MSPVDSMTKALNRAVAEGVFPGAVLLVRVRGNVVCHEAVGRVGLSSSDKHVHVGTIYDLASLTKPIATATAIVGLVEDGLLSLDQPVSFWFEELQERAVGSATIRQLLHHSSGLPAWRPYYEELPPTWVHPPGPSEIETRKRSFLNRIGLEDLHYAPGTQSLYSDLGFLLLGLVVEQCTARSLADYCRERMYAPLQADPLFFIDAIGAPVGGHGDLQEVAPTEHDAWRGRLLQGEVHDENAYALGGIAGHAGLFGTVSALSVMAGAWLQGALGRKSLLPSSLVKECVVRQDGTPGSSWGLGWDTPSSPSSSGSRFSPSSFGHLGFTGTSLWIDPSCELEVVLLSNRVHPTRRNNKIQDFRPYLHDLIYQEFVG